MGVAVTHALTSGVRLASGNLYTNDCVNIEYLPRLLEPLTGAPGRLLHRVSTFQGRQAQRRLEVFADGFSGLDQVISTGKAQRRPCGLAQGLDGALYVSDDVKGTIYKITYQP